MGWFPSCCCYSTRADTMLNLMWTTEGQAVVKEEEQDTCSDPGSPLLLTSLADSSAHHHHYSTHQTAYGLTVSLTPDSFYYPEESPQLQLLQPLPSFQSLPSSPRKQVEFPVVSVHEFTATSLLDCSTALHSPDSSSGGGGGQLVGMLPLAAPPLLQDSALRRRKRSNSGSSGSSGTSSTSKTVKRRRPPISQEELMNQRNQGKEKTNAYLHI